MQNDTSIQPIVGNSAIGQDTPKDRPIEVIDEHGWQIRVANKAVDPNMRPEQQGYKVIDPAAAIPMGNMNTRWATTTSLIASNDPADATEISNRQNIQAQKGRVSKEASGKVVAVAVATDTKRRHWTKEENLELVQARCDGKGYTDVSKKLRRGLKACQLQFGRLRSQSPYKEMLKEAQYKWAKEDWFDEEVEAEVDESDDAQADNFGV